mmetsp:Transcript_13911/g.37617  ORF Transcript_13911/g.37617 Transcript_13911/m.37617 type:complete len:267 (-) Transcript_13911:575-1375(-)
MAPARYSAPRAFKPAMEMRPSMVRYTWCLPVRRSHWGRVRPVYVNIPICFSMKDQSPGTPARLSACVKELRMALMRLAMPASSSHHSRNRTGSPMTLAAISAPWRGGLLYMGLMTRRSWPSTSLATSALLLMMDSAPTRSPYRPMFLAKDCASMSSWGLPSGAVALANMRSDAASAFRSPLAKPWYALSKKGSKRRLCTMSKIALHCWGVGSTPVGLWAHACRITTAPGSALPRSAMRPWKSRPRDFGSKYRYSCTCMPAFVKMFL